MNGQSQFFANFFARLDAALATYVDVVATRMYNVITPASKGMFVLLVIMFGYRLMWGEVREPLREGAARVIRGAVILGLLQIGNYNAFFTEFFMKAPDQLAAAIAGELPGDRVHFLDSLWSQQYAFGDAFWQKGSAAGMSGIALQGFALLVWAIALLATGGSAALLLVAKAGLYVWLAIGPFFVLMAMLDATRQFTNSWLGQTVTFALLPMLTSAVIYLVLSLCNAYLLDIDAQGLKADPAINQAGPFLFVCAAACVFLKQIPSFASGLGGGVAVSTLGAVGAAFSALKGGAASAGNLLSGKTLSDMRGERYKKAKNAEWAKNNPGLTSRAAGLPMAAYRKLTNPGKNSVAKA